jgi:hypothetical protein
LRSFLDQFERFCQQFHWDANERAFQLHTALKGKAAQCLWGLRDNAMAEDMIQALKSRYVDSHLIDQYRAQLHDRKRKDGDSISDLCDDLSQLLVLGFPNADEETKNYIGKDVFFRAIEANANLQMLARDERAMVFGDIAFDEIVAIASPLAAFPPAAASVETFLLSTPPTVVGVASPVSATSSAAADVERTVAVPVTARPTSIDDLAIAIFDESDRDSSVSDEQVFKRVAARCPNRPATDDRRIADLCRAEVLWDRLKFQRGLHAVNSLPESASASTVRRTLMDVLTPRAARPIIPFYGSRSHPYGRRRQ